MFVKHLQEYLDQFTDGKRGNAVSNAKVYMQMKVLLGWRMWNAIWCGENLILLLFVTFSSIVKKCPELL